MLTVSCGREDLTAPGSDASSVGDDGSAADGSAKHVHPRARTVNRRQREAALALVASLFAACTLTAPPPPGGGATAGGSSGSGAATVGADAGSRTTGEAAGGSRGNAETGGDDGRNGGEPAGGSPDSAGTSSTAGTSGMAGTGSRDFCDPACGPGETCDRGMACVCELTACPQVCTDLRTDPQNCGACGHVCPAQCNAGRCLKRLTTVVNESVVRFALTTTELFFTSSTEGTVSKIPIAGGSAVVLASAQAWPWGVAVDSSNVYWLNRGLGNDDGTVMKLARAGGTPATTLATGEASPSAIAIDATNVYWTNELLGGAIAQVPIGGGQRGELVAGAALTVPQELTVNGAYAYWISQGQDYAGSIMRVPVAGGTAVTLATGQSGSYMAVYGGSAYFFGPGAASGSINQISAAGGNPSFVSTVVGPAPLAVDSSGVYCAGVGTDREDIVHISLDGATVTTLAISPYLPTAIALDSNNVYWATNKGIYSASKP